MWFTMATIINLALLLMCILYRAFWREAGRRWKKETKQLQTELEKVEGFCKAATKALDNTLSEKAQLQAELDTYRWKKQVPDTVGHWLRVNAVGRVEHSKIFKDSYLDNKLSIYWGWSPQSKCLVENIREKLGCFYWLGPLTEPPEKALKGGK